MNIKAVIVSFAGAVVLGAGVSQSCTAIATSSVGLAIIKRVLLGGVSKGMKTLKNKDAFMSSPLIESAMPSGLKQLNNILEKVSPDLVKKEKEYIADAASFVANVAEPILTNAVNGLTADDVSRIMNGEPGMATQILREKTYTQLVNTLQPKVDEKLNEYGIVKTINNATGANSLLGVLMGNTTEGSSLSQFATEQIVTGLFYVIQDYEKENSKQFLGK